MGRRRLVIRFKEGMSALVQGRISTFLDSGLGALLEIEILVSRSVALDLSTFVSSRVGSRGEEVASLS
jgi:hypothetical protein